MLKQLIIINAGNFGREVYAWARQSPEHGVDWQIKGFLDNRRDLLRGYTYDVPILGGVEQYEPNPDDVFACAIGDVRARIRYSEPILRRGGQFVNVIHRTVVMGENVTLGIGVILCPYVVVCSDVTIGDFVSVNIHSYIAHDVQIGSYCQIDPHAAINGWARLGRGATVHSNATILPKAVVEEDAVVGAGSVLLRSARAGQTVFGVPARPIGVPKDAE